MWESAAAWPPSTSESLRSTGDRRRPPPWQHCTFPQGTLHPSGFLGGVPCKYCLLHSDAARIFAALTAREITSTGATVVESRAGGGSACMPTYPEDVQRQARTSLAILNSKGSTASSLMLHDSTWTPSRLRRLGQAQRSSEGCYSVSDGGKGEIRPPAKLTPAGCFGSPSETHYLNVVLLSGYVGLNTYARRSTSLKKRREGPSAPIRPSPGFAAPLPSNL